MINRRNNIQWMEVWNKIAGSAGDNIWTSLIKKLMTPVWESTKQQVWDKTYNDLADK